MDKRSEGQFRKDTPLSQPYPTMDTGADAPTIHAGTGTPVEGAPEGKQRLKIESNGPLSFIGGAGGRMQAISNNEREAGTLEGESSVHKVEGGKWRVTSTKKGRSELSKDLGLPNKKEFRKSKSKK